MANLGVGYKEQHEVSHLLREACFSRWKASSQYKQEKMNMLWVFFLMYGHLNSEIYNPANQDFNYNEIKKVKFKITYCQTYYLFSLPANNSVSYFEAQDCYNSKYWYKSIEQQEIHCEPGQCTRKGFVNELNAMGEYTFGINCRTVDSPCQKKKLIPSVG